MKTRSLLDGTFKYRNDFFAISRNTGILIVCDDLYKLYENGKEVYLIFDKVSVKYKDGHKKIYKFNEELDDISNILKDKNIYYSVKELNKLKLLELKEIQLKFGTTSTKKVDIINDIIYICSKFD